MPAIVSKFSLTEGERIDFRVRCSSLTSTQRVSFDDLVKVLGVLPNGLASVGYLNFRLIHNDSGRVMPSEMIPIMVKLAEVSTFSVSVQRFVSMCC